MAPPGPDVQAEIRTMIDTISRLYARGWCDGTGGNYSHVLSRDPWMLLLTRSGVDKGRICPADFLVVDPELHLVEDAAEGTPSTEGLVHVAIARHTGTTVILHTHSVWGTLLSEHFAENRGFNVTGYEMIKGLAGIESPREQVHIPVVRNAQDGHELAEGVSRVLARRPDLHGFLIAGHGLYTWGSTAAEAYRHVEIFEFLFRLIGQRVPLEPFA